MLAELDRPEQADVIADGIASSLKGSVGAERIAVFTDMQIEAKWGSTKSSDSFSPRGVV